MRHLKIFFMSMLIVTLLGCSAEDQNSYSYSVPDAQEAKALIAKIDAFKAAVKKKMKATLDRGIKASVFRLYKRKRLKAVLNAFITLTLKDRFENEQQKLALVDQAYTVIETEVQNYGKYRSWDEITREGEAFVRSVKNRATDQGIAALAFGGLYPIQGPEKNSTNWTTLMDAQQSWLERESLTEGARKSVWVFSWAFYNDLTGNKGVTQLIEKHRAGVDVRVIVDGNVAKSKGYHEALDRLDQAGVPLIRWRVSSNVGFGMHRKILIVDHQDPSSAAALFGGRNYGDNYSHLKVGMQPREYWRDAEAVVRGPAVQATAKIFEMAWNQAIENKVKSPAVVGSIPEVKSSLGSCDLQKHSGCFGIVDHEPTLDPRDRILQGTLLMIERAQSRIELSNAYFILPKPIKLALHRASNRGVEVLVHTNSHNSLAKEDQILLGPLYNGLLQVMEKEGVSSDKYVKPRIFLQKTTVLHSKYLVVDGQMGWLGNYNIHPRSSLLESETVGFFMEKPREQGVAAEMSRYFNEDIDPANSTEVTDLNDLKKRISKLSYLIEHFFYNQL